MRSRRALGGGSVVDKTIHARKPQLIKLPFALPSIPILEPLISPLIGGSNPNTSPSTTAATSTPPPAQPTSPSSPPSSNGGGVISGSTPSTGSNGSPTTGGNSSPTTGSDGSRSTGIIGSPSIGIIGSPSTGGDGTPNAGGNGPPNTGGNGSPSNGSPSAGGNGSPSAGGNGSPSTGGNGSPSAGGTGNGSPSIGSDGSPSTGGNGSPSAGGTSNGSPSIGSDGPPSTGGDGPPSTGSDGSSSTGGDGSLAAVPPIVVPGSGTGSGTVSGDTRTAGSLGNSPTTGSSTLPSGVSTVASPTSGSVLEGEGGVAAAMGSDNLGNGTNDLNGAVANAANTPDVTNASQGNRPKKSGGSNTLTAGGSSSTASGNDPNNATPVSGAEKGHMSTGAIAAIVIICLAFFFFLLVFLFRRRSRARRNEQANTWWFSRKRVSQTYGDTEVLVAGSQSARRSLATTSTIPRPPPMAEVGRVTASSLQTFIDPSRYNTEIPDTRFSVGSNHSENSQFLFVNLRSSLQINPETDQALSPSESFAFPKPPPPAGDRTSAYSRPISNHGTLRATMNSDNSIFASLPPVPSPPFAAPLIGNDPFTSDPFADNNPFEGSQPAAAPATLKGVIRRPYQRSLEDEVTVVVGEYVHVLTTFEDGWAYVVKVSPSGSDRDNEDTSDGSKGLIPIDCLRESDEDLSAFIAAKRLSNYSDGTTFTAL